MKTNVQLTNLKPKGKDTFIYRTGDTGDVIEVEVEYSSGAGHNRGIWVRVQPVTLSDGCKSFMLFSGFSVMVEPLERSKPSALAAAAAKLDPQAIQLAQLFTVDKGQAKEAVRELYGLQAPATKAPAQFVPTGGAQ